jgi:hypothetical protein
MRLFQIMLVNNLIPTWRLIVPLRIITWFCVMGTVHPISARKFYGDELSRSSTWLTSLRLKVYLNLLNFELGTWLSRVCILSINPSNLLHFMSIWTQWWRSDHNGQDWELQSKANDMSSCTVTVNVSKQLTSRQQLTRVINKSMVIMIAEGSSGMIEVRPASIHVTNLISFVTWLWLGCTSK